MSEKPMVINHPLRTAGRTVIACIERDVRGRHRARGGPTSELPAIRREKLLSVRPRSCHP